MRTGRTDQPRWRSRRKRLAAILVITGSAGWHVDAERNRAHLGDFTHFGAIGVTNVNRGEGSPAEGVLGCARWGGVTRTEPGRGKLDWGDSEEKVSVTGSPGCGF